MSQSGYKLYIGNLPINKTEDELQNTLKDTFIKFGKIKDLFLIRDKFSAEMRGFGFITYFDREAAQAAFEMNGKKLFEDIEKELRIDWARERDRTGFKQPSFLANQW